MKFSTLVAVASLASAGLASAIPSGEDILPLLPRKLILSGVHGHFHKKRDGAAPVVETVTQTFYQTVVWVNEQGQTISTQVNSPPPGAIFATPPAGGQFGGHPGQGGGHRRPNSRPPAPPVPSSPPPQPLPSNAASASSPVASQQSSSVAPQSSEASVPNKGAGAAPGGMGICYDMIDSSTACKSPATINSEFAFLKSQGYGQVRIYDIGCPVNNFATAAAQNGLRMMAGINTIANLQGDLGKLVGMMNGNWNPIDTIYIGNELVNSGAASPGQVAAAVTTAKGILSGAGFTGNVVTVDTFNQILAHPEICSTSDFCAANTHAFFDPNTPAASAGDFVYKAYQNMASRVGGKKVVITESGWPWKGSCNGQACPSLDNQKTAMNSIMKSFAGQSGNIFMFQAYDAGYKAAGSLGVEQFFGIYDSDHYNGGIGSGSS